MHLLPTFLGFTLFDLSWDVILMLSINCSFLFELTPLSTASLQKLFNAHISPFLVSPGLFSWLSDAEETATAFI